MSTLIHDGTDALLDLLKTKGLPAVTSAMGKLTEEAKEDWQKSLLKIGINLVSEHGLDGLEILESTVNLMLDGKPVNLKGLTMSEASNILAVMQRREANHRNQVTAYVNLMIKVIADAVKVVVVTMFGELKL